MVQYIALTQYAIGPTTPGLVEDSQEKYGHLFPGYNIIPMQKLAETYLDIVEGDESGQVIRLYD